MNTFIFPWRPGCSDNVLYQSQQGLINLDFGDFYLPTEGLENARSGDNFYVIWIDEDPFVVVKGFFISDPDMETGQIQIRPTFMALPNPEIPRFRMRAAEGMIPSFAWSRYCEGAPLPDGVGKKLADLWEEYLSSFGEDLFDGVHAERSRKPAANVDDAIEIAAEAYCDEVDPLDGRPAIIAALRPALQFKKDESVICSALRDIVGRCGWTPGKLRDWGFTEAIVDRLILLKRKEGESLADRLLQIGHSGDNLAFKITADDLEHRMRHDREDARDSHLHNLVLLYDAAGQEYKL